MTLVRIKGFKIFKDRHGRMRCYHRATGQKIDLTAAPIGSAAFLAECEKIRTVADANKAKAPPPCVSGTTAADTSTAPGA